MSTPVVRTGRIHILPPEMVARIAAGEVIERPVSVLKELVENSLDAQATRVDVRLAADPATFLEVADDGCGFTPEELPVALTRHATSKMPESGNLHDVRTLGFRGEAMPAIAMVAHLTVETRTAGAQAGTRAVAFGDRLRLEDCAHAPGTTARVEDLFGDLPPRRKFLRAPRSEVKAAVRLVTAYALARPDVAFSLEVEERVFLRWPRAATVAERVRQVFEVAVEDGFVVLRGGTPPLSVQGFLGRPERHRSTREEQTFLVNGRWVQSGSLSQALRQGYRSLLPSERHPLALVMLQLPGEEVDVNFHPAKREVRFAREGWVWNELRRAVEHSLSVLGHHPGAQGAGSGMGAGSGAGVGGSGAMMAAGAGAAEWPELYRTRDSLPAEIRERFVAPAGPEDEEVVEKPQGPHIALWQLHRTYVLAPIKQGLLIVDQHAAHERILYEQALRRLRGKLEAGQALLFPLVLDLDAEEFDSLLLVMPHLEKLGFSFERLSGRSVAVRSIPAGVRRWEDGQALRQLLAEAKRFANEPEGTEGIVERVARSFACHSAVKAGDPLGPEEMQALIDGLFATSLPHGDVHGRPTLIRLGLEDFERFFGRRRGQPLL